MRVERFVNSIFKSNTYVITRDGCNDAWLVDCGDIGEILSTLLPDYYIKGIFLTHTHFDHIYGLNELISYFPQSLIYTNQSGKDALYSDRLNFSRYYEQSFILKNGNIKIIESCGTSVVDSLDVEIFETPGHDPSCITYCIDNFIFTGDSYIPNVKTVTKLRGGNKFLAKKSEELILNLANNRKLILCPGHGEMEQF